jgi:hypothetical protein
MIFPSIHYFEDWLCIDTIVTVDNANQRTVYFPPFTDDAYMSKALTHYDDIGVIAKRSSAPYWEFLSNRVQSEDAVFNTIVF